jgi:membrane-associated protease RseP (regulator of RpoE activity)
MQNRFAWSASFWVSLFGLLLVASVTLQAQPPEPPPPGTVEHHKVVMIDGDGHERTWESGPNVKRGYLGIAMTELSPELRTHFGAPENAGVMVAHVEPGSPAEKAGLAVGDIIVAMDGQLMESSFDIRGHLRDLDEGTLVGVEVRRANKTKTLKTTVEKREHMEVDMAPLFKKRMGDGGDIILDMVDREKMPMVIPAPRSGREVELEKRLKDLEKRLKDLEARLPKQ